MDPGEFKKLALSELDAVYRLAYHLTPSGVDAEDMVQDTYLRAFKSADSFVLNTPGIRPWLFKILHNVLSSRLSRDQHRRELEDDLYHQPSHASAEVVPCALGQQGIDWDRVDERLKSAIERLSLDHRTAFLMDAVEGLNQAEIAEVTGVPIGTVKSRLCRARAILTTRLAGRLPERAQNKGETDKNRGTNPLSEG